jgi:hypothetical protein
MKRALNHLQWSWLDSVSLFKDYLLISNETVFSLSLTFVTTLQLLRNIPSRFRRRRTGASYSFSCLLPCELGSNDDWDYDESFASSSQDESDDYSIFSILLLLEVRLRASYDSSDLFSSRLRLLLDACLSNLRHATKPWSRWIARLLSLSKIYVYSLTDLVLS